MEANLKLICFKSSEEFKLKADNKVIEGTTCAVIDKVENKTRSICLALLDAFQLTMNDFVQMINNVIQWVI